MIGQIEQDKLFKENEEILKELLSGCPDATIYRANPESQMLTRWSYVFRKCESCKKAFIKPSTWRTTKLCPECRGFTKEYKRIAREVSKIFVDAAGWPTECQICECETDDLQIHHIVPVSKGGGPGLHNLQILCLDCHAKMHESED